ncbi:hypothetical protein M422DRAFT_46337 [Sphaerobolus stellatus SS14]|uniref:CCHC-type domain-containing protein n=1 Tax=Sphaerobolus stellatus (strain SS14) TaxID=990650 RepID=A0A0C9UT51_SPHS4|nr:hypothetical protein M422DRAFT_46337 [Sphaerobolus stellatus SS14]
MPPRRKGPAQQPQDANNQAPPEPRRSGRQRRPVRPFEAMPRPNRRRNRNPQPNQQPQQQQEAPPPQQDPPPQQQQPQQGDAPHQQQVPEQEQQDQPPDQDFQPQEIQNDEQEQQNQAREDESGDDSDAEAFRAALPNDVLRGLMRGHLPNALGTPNEPSPKSVRKRPTRIPGLTVSGAELPIPNQIRQKFVNGWSEHVPLTYLTDAYCAKAANDPKVSQDIVTWDPISESFTTTSKTLPGDGESRLSYAEWNEAWRRLLELIRAHLPEDYEAWKIHYTRIRDAIDVSARWNLWLQYDIQLRQQACRVGLDPATFNEALWRDLQPDFLAKQAKDSALEEIRRELSLALPSSSVKRRHSLDRSEPVPKRRRDTNPIKTRCFHCGSSEHPARDCKQTSLVNGRPLFLRLNDTGIYSDNTGIRYCFSFNGVKGCTTKSGYCTRGVHRCTLCGGNHSAQQCTNL